MIDKSYCCSSYLAFRYIVDDSMDFSEGIFHQKYVRIPDREKIMVRDAAEVDVAIANVMAKVSNEKLGILLSGGMDSAVLASYMPEGSDAYTFRFLGGAFQKEELMRAERYAAIYGLNLHYVDIDWSAVVNCIDDVMKHKGAPVHSIEPQIFYAAQQAKNDGVTLMIIGDGADYVFGGMDRLLSRNWTFDEFVNRYLYVNPNDVLNEPSEILMLFEKYRIGPSSIDFMRILDDMTVDESYASYENAFETAGLAMVDPYARMRMSCPLDLARIRNGESKYIIRDLFKKKYSGIPVPEKLPMPRPVDVYFADWIGPSRPEFRKGLDMTAYSGNQKWLIWCLEHFLNLMETK